MTTLYQASPHQLHASNADHEPPTREIADTGMSHEAAAMLRVGRDYAAWCEQELNPDPEHPRTGDPDSLFAGTPTNEVMLRRQGQGVTTTFTTYADGVTRKAHYYLTPSGYLVRETIAWAIIPRQIAAGEDPALVDRDAALQKTTEGRVVTFLGSEGMVELRTRYGEVKRAAVAETAARAAVNAPGV